MAATPDRFNLASGQAFDLKSAPLATSLVVEGLRVRAELYGRLARVAVERGDSDEAYSMARQAASFGKELS